MLRNLEVKKEYLSLPWNSTMFNKFWNYIEVSKFQSKFDDFSMYQLKFVAIYIFKCIDISWNLEGIRHYEYEQMKILQDFNKEALKKLPYQKLQITIYVAFEEH